MARSDTQAKLGQRAQRALEPLALQVEQGVGEVVCRGEVRGDGVDHEIGTGEHLGERPAEVVEAEAQPVHPGVDLEVAVQAAAAFPRRSLKRAGRRR